MDKEDKKKLVNNLIICVFKLGEELLDKPVNTAREKEFLEALDKAIDIIKE
ncbi:hypothetical protein LZ11_00961 [Thermosediminibacter litoriperuensis]|uniref:Uncharacterized protein n=2 Tax=Thermosediminibacter litoriperuensis TaxID=291989 RepID=A0A5S5AX74_9FIRM|nr:hypothetical protein LZ11_00961 [Thermosediminibacter litoriperuensis]